MIGLYARVSTQEQVNGYSIDEQTSRMKDFCKAMGWKDHRIYIDAGVSGSSIDRPALQNLIKDVQAGNISKIIVYKLDRLSRSQKDTLYLIEDIFLASGSDFLSITENFDTSTPFGRAMIGILAVFAQLEREQIRERMSLGMEGRAKQGKWKGGGPQPFGYSYIEGELRINEFEALQIKELYDLFLSGYSMKEIERTFRKKGYTRQGRQWTKTAIKNALHNRLYAGYIFYKGETYKGTHEPIISLETYNQAAGLLAQIKDDYESRHKKQGTSYTALLSGILYCGNCGAKYYSRKQTQRGKVFRYYSCYSREKTNLAMVKDPDCKNKTWRQEKLDGIILAEIGKLATDPAAILQNEGKRKDSSEKISILAAEIERIESQRSRLIDLYSVGDFSAQELQQKIAPLTETKKRLESELEALKKSTQNALTAPRAVEIVSGFADIISRGNRREIRLLVDSLIDRIELYNEDIKIYWKFS